jgi:hypothetical protein
MMCILWSLNLDQSQSVGRGERGRTRRTTRGYCTPDPRASTESPACCARSVRPGRAPSLVPARRARRPPGPLQARACHRSPRMWPSSFYASPSWWATRACASSATRRRPRRARRCRARRRPRPTRLRKHPRPRHRQTRPRPRATCASSSPSLSTNLPSLWPSLSPSREQPSPNRAP